MVNASGAHVAIQQSVTSNLLATFAMDITSTQGQAIQIEYKFKSKMISKRDQNGGFIAIEVSGRFLVGRAPESWEKMVLQDTNAKRNEPAFDNEDSGA